MSERDNLARAGSRRGRYEGWFLTMSDGVTGYWIRYTVRNPIVGPPEPRVWFARFDRDRPERTFGINAGTEAWGFSSGGGFEVRMGDSVLRSGHARGAIAGGGHEARWDLEWRAGDPTFRLLPPALYRGTLAPTKPWTPVPDARFRGEVEIDGERAELADMPGQQGHLVGTRHAERWAWAFGNAFPDGQAFQALCAQSRRGPLTTPHLTFAAVRLDDRWLRFHSAARRRPWSLGRWRLTMASRHHRLEGEVRAEPSAMVRARYLDPDDAERFCHNSEVASCHLTVWERRPGGWSDVAELVSEGAVHAEWAGRTPAPVEMAAHAEVA